MTDPQSSTTPDSLAIKVPEFGLGEARLETVSWLVEEGAVVIQGDRVVEVAATDVTMDVVAPATGTLTEQTVGEGEELRTGQVIGWIHLEEA